MIINTEKEYNIALRAIDILMDKDDSLDGLSELVDAIEAFEDKHYPICGE